QFRKLFYPIQDAFAHSDALFQTALHPKIVPLWSKMANFKGDTAASIKDVSTFVNSSAFSESPQFVFLNLMETHLPFWPPDTYIDKFAPYFKEDRAARDYIRRYNVETFRWLLPIEDRLDQTAERVVSDLYDAEVNYQDHLLGQLLETLNNAENTLTIIVADHGEGIGEHSFMGHSFVAYQELVHVPLIVKFPESQGANKRIKETVSTRRLFHTILDAAQARVPETAYRPALDIKGLTLSKTVEGDDPEQGVVFAEAYPPNTFLFMMKKRVPHLIDRFHCDSRRWAAYQDGYKLARTEGIDDELFQLNDDPKELNNIAAENPEQTTKLNQTLKSFVTQAIGRQLENEHVDQSVDIELDENMTQQLRALGYID
ncbi:MAG: sulfatase-like hydrolase/transferase, partial [Chloroflexota bacterium]